jgi:hypothetical protein
MDKEGNNAISVGKWYLHFLCTKTTLTQDTLEWGPHTGPHSNVSCVSEVACCESDV